MKSRLKATSAPNSTNGKTLAHSRFCCSCASSPRQSGTRTRSSFIVDFGKAGETLNGDLFKIRLVCRKLQKISQFGSKIIFKKLSKLPNPFVARSSLWNSRIVGRTFRIRTSEFSISTKISAVKVGALAHPQCRPRGSCYSLDTMK